MLITNILFKSDKKHTMLDVVREAISTIKNNLEVLAKYSPFTPQAKLKAPWLEHSDPEDSFGAFLTRTWHQFITDRVRERDEKEAEDWKKTEEKKTATIASKIEKSKALLAYFEGVEKVLLEHNAKTWAEIRPADAARVAANMEAGIRSEAEARRAAKLARKNRAVVEPEEEVVEISKVFPLEYFVHRTTWDSGELVAAHTRDKYEELFAACFSGDKSRVEHLCLPAKNAKRDKDSIFLQIACSAKPNLTVPLKLLSEYQSYPSEVTSLNGAWPRTCSSKMLTSYLGYTPLQVAILAEQWETAEVIIAIATAQHKKREESEQNFTARGLRIGGSRLCAAMSGVLTYAMYRERF